MTKEIGEYNGEAEMAGCYAGAVFGGLGIGALGDILHSEVNSMAWYAAGILLGAIAGTIAASLFRKMA
jgi:hypothetical protein